jgi:hypothetical protein
VVLNVDGKALLVGIETWPTGNGPALHDAVEFEPQIVVKTPRGVLLDDVSMALGGGLTAPWLGGNGKTTLFPVNLESHRHLLAPFRRD